MKRLAVAGAAWLCLCGFSPGSHPVRTAQETPAPTVIPAPPPEQPVPEKIEPAPPPPAEEKPAAAEPLPPGIEEIPPGTAVGVLGKPVQSSAGEDMGRIVDILVDVDGKPRAAVIDFGGFLGVGNRKIGIDWRLLQFDPAGKHTPVLLVLSRDRVKAAPEYKEDANPPRIVGIEAADQPPPPPPPDHDHQ